MRQSDELRPNKRKEEKRKKKEIMKIREDNQ